VICLVHGEVNFEPTDTAPFPERILSDSFVGCDTVIPPGGAQTFDFDELNTPHFGEFVARLTNGIDENVNTVVALTSGALGIQGATGAGGFCESILATLHGQSDGHDKHEGRRRCRPEVKNPDWIGYEIVLVRLHVIEFEIVVANEGHTTSLKALALRGKLRRAGWWN
jgi:hypothetical protein